MPQLKPHLAVRAIRPLVSGLRECGYDAAPILAAVGIDDSMLNDPDSRVPTSVAMNLLSRAVDETRDTNLGLHLAERAELGSFDVHFYAMASSPTLGDAYGRLARYQRLIHETSRVELEIEDRAVLLGFSELSSFHRAFKRWTGRTPAQFRQEFRSPRR